MKIHPTDPPEALKSLTSTLVEQLHAPHRIVSSTRSKRTLR